MTKSRVTNTSLCAIGTPASRPPSPLAISASYLSQLENDDRPLTPALIERLSRAFPLDWREIGAGDAETRLAALREANADPLFPEPLDAAQLARFAEQQPALAERFIALHEAYRRGGQRLAMVDEALASESAGTARLPWLLPSGSTARPASQGNSGLSSRTSR